MTVGIAKKRIPRQTRLRRSEGDTMDLIQEARRDRDAFAQLYLAYYDDVFNYCNHRLFDHYAAEDVTSTVFNKVMVNLNAFKGGNFRNWLLRIATYAVNDYLRDARRRAELVQKAVIHTRAESIFVIDYDEELLEKKALMKEALLSLKPKYQTVITLRCFENKEPIEIAAILGTNPNTVRSWLSRATAKLRKRLNGTMDNRGFK